MHSPPTPPAPGDELVGFSNLSNRLRNLKFPSLQSLFSLICCRGEVCSRKYGGEKPMGHLGILQENSPSSPSPVSSLPTL